ncbi:FadR/GntR family transcriptional regulator [Amaricoccus sp. W119]|uniref:FadR/GntR family transcriptional regulator n=1 Tax=Amaricoccus sp. W119 TaxID=3391833 RepID=UPI0039A5A68A
MNVMTDHDEKAGGERSKPGLADRVYHLLYSRISNGDYPANQKLPSEKVLADEFGVSRPVLRAALERLREQGIIHSRQGAGSYVREVKTAPLGFARVETIADIQRCYEFRICIEAMAARLAAARRDTGALAEIGTALSLMEGATDSLTHREDADFAFHLAVSQAANNQYFEASMRALREHIYVGMKLHGQSLMTDGAQGLREVFEEHSAIFAAIREGDGETAERLMRGHLTHSRDRLFGGALIDLGRG